MNTIKCLKCNSTDVDVEDLGLTSTEHYCSCENCGNVNQSDFQESGKWDAFDKETQGFDVPDEYGDEVMF